MFMIYYKHFHPCWTFQEETQWWNSLAVTRHKMLIVRISIILKIVFCRRNCTTFFEKSYNYILFIYYFSYEGVTIILESTVNTISCLAYLFIKKKQLHKSWIISPHILCYHLSAIKTGIKREIKRADKNTRKCEGKQREQRQTRRKRRTMNYMKG